MSTTKTFKVNQNISRQLKCRAVGYYDYTNIVTPTKENSDINVEMQKYDGLKYTWNSNGGGIPIIDFSGTVLPWKYEMNSYLARTRYCCVSKSDTPHNIAIYQPIYRYIENVGGVTDNDGVVSDFSTSKYLKIKENFNPNYPWSVIFKFNLSNIPNSSNILLGYNSSGIFKLTTFEGKIEFGVSTSASDWTIGQILSEELLQPNTNYWVKAEFTGTSYDVYLSTDGSGYDLIGTINSSEAFTMPDELLIGMGGWQFNEVFTGSIDLNETFITGYFLANGEYAQQTRKMSDANYVLEKQNVNVVGSPTIENNIVSGFSSSNYLTLNRELVQLNATYVFKVTFPSSMSSNQCIFEQDYFANIEFRGNTQDLRAWNWQAGQYEYIMTPELGKTYWFKMVINGSVKTYLYSEDGQDYIEAYVMNDNATNTTTTNFFIGVTSSRGNVFQGSIDLSKSYIKFNGKKTYLFGSVVEELYGITDGVFSTNQIAYCYVNRDKTLVVRKTKTENLDTSDWYLGEVYLKLGLPNPDFDV